MSIFSRMSVASGGMVLALALAGSPVAGEEGVVQWRMNSLLYPKLFGEAGERFAGTVKRLSGGTFVIEVQDRLVLDQHSFGALESGLIDAVWGSAGHHHREDPALTIFTGFPFGPDPAEFTAWMLTGGGTEALDAIYARHRLKSIFCGVLPSEGGGWFVAPVESLGALDGLGMRSFGYGARVLGKLGVLPYELPAGEIRPALKAGLIAGAEFSLPSIDVEIGIADVARHLYFPGWQQPATSLEILMPERTWTALSDQHKAVLQAACGESLAWTAANAATQQIEAITALRAEGVQVHVWSEEILTALRHAWDEVIAEDTARDPLLADAWAGYLRFREGYADWDARAYAN